ncbi:MAG: hypothetical protein KDK00_10680 [Rhodobacteraceae bacterium]|nr:hypothetical protein [Paracoccaceae bacterium]
MSFENLKAAIALLMEQASETPHDAHEIYEELREKLAELRGLGLPLPDDLVKLEERLQKDLGRK